jgi:Tol biopolymer transport system component
MSRKNPVIVVWLLGLFILVPIAVRSESPPAYVQSQILFGASFRNQRLGEALDARDDLIVAGAPWAGRDGVTPDGLVYTYNRRNDNEWDYSGSMLFPPGWLRGGHFGYELALDGETLAVTARLPSDLPSENIGAVFIYSLNDGQWVSQAVLVPPTLPENRGFGEQLALDGDTLVAVASGIDERGTAYVYHRSGVNWQTEATITLPSETPSGHLSAVAVAGDVLLLGDEAYSSDPADDNRGRVFVYTRRDGIWSPGGMLQPDDGQKNDYFGCAIDFDGTTAVIAACSLGRADVADRAYIFRFDGQTWTQAARLDPSLGDEIFDITSVAFDGDRVLLGASQRLYQFLPPFLGAAFLFEQQGAAWVQTQVLRPDDWDMGGWFATAAVLAGGDAVVSAPDRPVANRAEQGVLFVFRPRPPSTALIYAPAVARQELTRTTGLIVFEAPGNGGARDLYLATTEGRGRTQLTDTPANDYDAAWSPDGRRLIFVREGGNGQRLVILELESGRETFLSMPGELGYSHPDWSPDGQRIVFDDVRGLQRDIYTANIDGTGLRNLTDSLQHDEHSPVWSPDGTRIAYIDEGEVMTKSSEGGDIRQLTFGYTRAGRPDWSPDGAFILYHRPYTGADGAGDEIWVVDAVTGDVEAVIRHARDGRWSPDGSRVVFAGESGGIYHIDPTSLFDLIVISNSPFGNMPAWQP